MPNYIHDMMHCSQEQCKLKDKCYRFWLGKEGKNHGYMYASFYMPEKIDNTKMCDYFLAF